jgi:tRNAThr (cytosine32-N3)-methyltransferase
MRILCVCSGNTCRSPMLAALLRARLGARAVVESAGTGAATGDAASDGAVRAMRRRGLSLAEHRSRPLSAVDLASVDWVLTMSARHSAAVLAAGVPAAKVRVVNADQDGVPDPFGGSDGDYEACAQVLERFATHFAEMKDEMKSPSEAIPRACAALDAANAADPKRGPGGRADALRYADGISGWIPRLVPAPSPALVIAARGQHLERWAIPRGEFPLDKPGYLRWRKALQLRQGQRARELLAGVVDDATRERVGLLVSKSAPKGDAEAQALEDAACLVFLESEIAAFAAGHADYTADKYVDILRKTWAKMSPAGRQAALGLHLAEPYASLVKRAVG